MKGMMRWTAVLVLSGSVLLWVRATVDKLTPDQIGMIWMAIIVGGPFCILMGLMIVKADADRRMDHVERLEQERTARQRQTAFPPPVVVVTGGQPQYQRPAIDQQVLRLEQRDTL